MKRVTTAVGVVAVTLAAFALVGSSRDVASSTTSTTSTTPELVAGVSCGLTRSHTNIDMHARRARRPFSLIVIRPHTIATTTTITTITTITR